MSGCGESGIALGRGDVPILNHRYLRTVGVNVASDHINGAGDHYQVTSDSRKKEEVVRPPHRYA